MIAARQADAEEFRKAIAPSGTTPEAMRSLRQACAGLVWSKQMYPSMPASFRWPVYGATERLQEDPAWRDNLLFGEYFPGDNGAGPGAMPQTGWTALVADLILDPAAAAAPLWPSPRDDPQPRPV